MKYDNMPPQQSTEETTSLEEGYSKEELQQAAQMFNSLIDDAIGKHESRVFGDSSYLTFYTENADRDDLRVHIESHRLKDGGQIRKLEIKPRSDKGEGVFYSCWGDDVQRLVMDLDDMRRMHDEFLLLEEAKELRLKYNQRTPVGVDEVVELRMLMESANPKP